LYPGAGEHVDECIDAEELDPALKQVADSGLSDAKHFCRFSLL
jgi:hypothetical protein